MRDFWSTAELKARGKTSREIAGAVSTGLLIGVRPRWLARPGADEELVRAVRVGGIATAHTAARARGLWTPPDVRGSSFGLGDSWPVPILHVAVPKTTSRSKLLDPDDAAVPLGERTSVVTYWSDPAMVRSARPHGVVPVLTMLRDMFRTEPPERALAVVDSALRYRHIRTSDLPALAALLPAHLGAVVAQADARAQSGTETITAFLLRAAGLHVEPQAEVAGVGHVDLLVEGRLIVELDGREWHGGDDAFEEDRRRDLVATIGRYRVLRFSWFRVLFSWHEVEAAVFAALAA